MANFNSAIKEKGEQEREILAAYFSNQECFSSRLESNLHSGFLKELKKIVHIYDPFEEARERIDFQKLAQIEESGSVKELKAFWKEFNDRVTETNNELMNKSYCMIALLDGAAVDDGVASEIGWFAAKHPGRPIFGVRGDIRLTENLAAPINPQVQGYIDISGGELFNGPDAEEKCLAAVQKWANEFFLDKEKVAS